MQVEKEKRQKRKYGRAPENGGSEEGVQLGRSSSSQNCLHSLWCEAQGQGSFDEVWPPKSSHRTWPNHSIVRERRYLESTSNQKDHGTYLSISTRKCGNSKPHIPNIALSIFSFHAFMMTVYKVCGSWKSLASWKRRLARVRRPSCFH